MSNTIQCELIPFDSRPPLPERIAAYQPHIDMVDVPTIGDKWVLASNLQKSIRRGLIKTAVGTATKLLAVDSSYFWRRLLVIAYEDIGVADIQLSHDLLKTFRREALHRQLGAERVAAYFADALSRACKSRALCDAIAMLEFNVRLGEIEKPCFYLTDSQLVESVCRTTEPLMSRVAALRHICGYRDNVYGSYRAATKPRPELMREVCQVLSLTDMEATLFTSGQSTSESLNIPLPVVVQLVRGDKYVAYSDQEFDGMNGLLFASLDRHTRTGKKCFTQLARNVEAIGKFFRQRPELNPAEAIGVAVFIIEGASLNRWVVFPQSDFLRQIFEQNFLEHAGVTGGGASELLHIVQDNLTELNRIRAEVIA